MERRPDDYGINLLDRPQVLKVTMGRYRQD
ncbi:hypothetical protein SPHINGO8AM_170001 [Sphingomonas sp. 8AM]|nr:hypothetical protein SPHINGO8AM_170001 [Sphingomonas sp. 8AM]